MYINSLAIMDTSSNAFKEAFETCKNIVDNSLETIRSISFDLMPKSLEHGGLVQALSELVNRLKIISHIEYNFPDIVLNLDKESQINIYRIIQEFINNSLRHAKNSKIEIHLSLNKKKLNLILKDNGKGFNMNELTYGNGIFNIKARINALNAKCDFGSIINKGTYLNLSILENDEKN
jgi:signal transduction histidine kinase